MMQPRLGKLIVEDAKVKFFFGVNEEVETKINRVAFNMSVLNLDPA